MRLVISRLRLFWAETHWILLITAWLTALGLSYFGFSQYSQVYGENWSAGDILYSTLQLVVLESGSITARVNWMLGIARFLLPALTAYTVLKTLLNLFKEQSAVLRLWGLHDHVVICGIGRKGSRLANELLELGRRVVAIERDPGQVNVEILRRKGAIVLIGDATSSDTLISARVQRARNLVCLLGEDSQNLQIACRAAKLVQRGRTEKLTCTIHVSSSGLLDLIKRSELAGEPDTPFELETFNPYARTARLLLNDDPAWEVDASHENIPGDLLVIGLGRLGENLIFQAGYLWHLLDRQGKLHITVVDRDAVEKIERLNLEHPQLTRVCELTPIQIDLSSPALLKSVLENSGKQGLYQRAYICLSDSVLSLQVCFALLDILTLPILVRLAENSGLTDLLLKPFPGLADTRLVKTFDLYETSCSAALLVSGLHEILARDLFEVYSSQGEPSTINQTWEELPEDVKKSNRRQAGRIDLLLKEANYRIYPLQDWEAASRLFSPEEIECMAQLEHDLWRKGKDEDGWHYGNNKDSHKHIHPDLVSWDELAETEREKNRAAVRRLPALLARAGFQIDRTDRVQSF